MNIIQRGIWGLAYLLLVQLSGCATYGSGIEKALQSAQKGQYLEAEQGMLSALSPTGSDRLLYHMELGVLKHLQGQYAESNALLDIAEIITEELEVSSMSNSLAAFMTNPRNGDYVGANFEKVFINYYKALNYMAISNGATSRNARLDAIESARIESRRLGIRLNALNSDKGTYAEQKDENDRLFAQVLDGLSALQGNLIDLDTLEYRDDAMAHYLTGITYETNSEYDNARISYQKAALSYEQGYSKQFDLGTEMISQAWFDTVRMMRLAGGYKSEWPRLANTKLSLSQRKQLAQYDDKSQLIIIEHVGIVPQRKEMDVQLSADAANRSLVLRPFYRSVKSHKEKLAWFYLVYADKSLVNLMIHYKNNDFIDFILNDFQKTIYLAGAWDALAELGAMQAIGSGIRVAVPYYSPPKNKPGASFVRVGGKKYTMKPAANPATMGLNEQLLSANKDIRLALARGIVKALAAQKAAELAGGQLGGLLAVVGQVASQLSDAAETRNWLMLPYEVRITRIPLDAGSYDIEMNSEVRKGKNFITQRQKIILQEGELQLVSVRSMPHLKSANIVPPENKMQKSVALIEQ